MGSVKKPVKRLKIGFIGGGNMGEALIGAVLRRRVFLPSQVGLTDADRRRLGRLRRKYRLGVAASNAHLTRSSEAILLAVKPQEMPSVLDEIRPEVTKNHLILSIAAGLNTTFLKGKLPPGTRIIRIMPNMCATIGEAASALFASPEATRRDRKFAAKIFSAAGVALFVEKEEWLDAVTAVSGSGPAFVFFLIDSLIEAGIKEGLPSELCRKLALQTFAGATKMAQLATEPLTDLIERVASKGGTTEAGLNIFRGRGLTEILMETIQAATDRARELSCPEPAEGRR